MSRIAVIRGTVLTRNRDDLRPGLQMVTSGRHCIFFEADESRVLVVRVLHDRDYRRHLLHARQTTVAHALSSYSQRHLALAAPQIEVEPSRAGASSLPVGLGPRRGRRANSVERQPHRTDADKVAVNEPCGRVESPIGNERSVLAAKIFNRCLVSRDSYQRVAPRNARRLEEELEIGIASHYVFALAEPCPAVWPR